MGVMCEAVIALSETPLTQALARRNAAEGRGVQHLLPAPLGKVAAFLVMDYGFYLWHVATHKMPFLWRFHRVHHLDRDLDMSTAIRFHFLDMLVSLPWRLVQVRVSGIDLKTLALWQKFFLGSILFHRSNARLPGRWDDRLAWLITTPRMHGIHHSKIWSEMDSNWSSGISLWDHLHRTLRQDVAQRTIDIGVDDPTACDDLGLARGLRAPFRPLPARLRDCDA